MPLNPLKLASALTDLFGGVPAFPADAAEAGEKWAEIYRQYASSGTAGPTVPVDAALTAAAKILATALAAAFTAAAAAGPLGAAAFLPLIDAAFVAFWAPIPFAPPPPAPPPPPPPPPAFAGVVTAPASGSLGGLMTTALAAGLIPGASTALQGSAVALALDTWTKTVSVVNTPLTPPGPPQKAIALI